MAFTYRVEICIAEFAFVYELRRKECDQYAYGLSLLSNNFSVK